MNTENEHGFAVKIARDRYAGDRTIARLVRELDRLESLIRQYNNIDPRTHLTGYLRGLDGSCGYSPTIGSFRTDDLGISQLIEVWGHLRAWTAIFEVLAAELEDRGHQLSE